MAIRWAKVGFNQPNQNFVAATDCSGFVACVLNTVIAPAASDSAYAALVTDASGNVINYQTVGHPQPFPSADDYANWIISGEKSGLKMIAFSQMQPNQFTKGGLFSEAQPGDILAYGLPSGSTDTGHVMVINSIQKIQRGVLNPGFWKTDLNEFIDPNNTLSFYAVSVYDSSNVEHYNDQRGNASAGTTGVGRGAVLIITDAGDAPIGFMFNAGFKLLQVEQIATSLPGDLIGSIGSLAVGRIV